MSEEYAREHLRRNVAQICQTIGWNGVNSTPLDILVHVLEKFIRTVGTQANIYTEQFNRTELNLHDIGLAFRDLHIQLPDLVEYTRSVPPVPSPLNVDKFPKPKEPNLNFLKPGSHEVVTRPMHVHEHLPPMYPEKERETPVVADTVEIRQNGIDTPGPSNATCTSPEISVTDSPEKNKDIFKRPNDPIAAPNSQKPRLRLEEEERTREISSVIMTMSGFLSPAREGKLPEAKAPTIVSEKHHDKQKANSHHSGLMKVPMHPSLEKSDKKSKKNKLLNGKIMKSKRRDKSHKGESSRSKDSKSDKYPPGHPSKSKEVAPSIYNHVTMPVPKLECQPSNKISPLPKAVSIPIPLPLPLPLVPESLKSVIKQEPVDLPIAAIPPVLTHKNTVKEDAIPVPRRIPISKSPLVNPLHVNKNPTPGLLMPGIEIKKEKLDEEEKLASQPDRSKINIFKRISNKTKEDKNTPEVVQEKSQSNTMISRLHNSSPHESTSEESKVKTQDSVVNNNDDSAVDLSKEMDLTTNEVISLDDDSYDMSPMPLIKPIAAVAPRPQLTINKALQVPFPKDIPTGSPKIKKERKHREKKDKSAEKAAKLEAKLIKKQQQQIAYEIAKAEKQSLKLANMKSRKLNRPKNDSSKMSQLPPGFPFFPNIPGRGLMPGPGLMPNPGLIPGGDFLAGLANNPALRGLHPPNLLANPFALGAGGPGLIPGPSLFPGALGPGMPNPLMSMSNFGHSSRSSNKIPTMLRRPSLEVIPVENDDRSTHKSPIMSREKDRHDKHKSTTIPNILQKQKSKSHKEGHKSNMYKMPPIHPDITIELNPPKPEPAKQEPPSAPQPPVHTHTPTPEPVKEPEIIQIEDPPPKVVQDKVEEKLDKKRDKSHKKEKKDKDFIKIKKKKDKKGKNKDKSEKKKKKEDKQEVKDKIKEEKKEKKKEKPVDGIVPKLTLKLGSASPMPPSSPDVVRLNIKPVVKKEDERSPSPKEEPVSRESSRSPELAQFSALVTRPPKQKHKHNNSSDTELKLSPPSSSSPSRKNRPPSSHKYKRISFKTLAKKGHVEQLDDDIESISDDAALPGPPPTTEQTPGGPLKTPYYVDEHGNKIWVCPACGRPDNGTPMIGCDGCDGWYHWICVGITEEPGATEDWFCKSCIAKRAAMVLAGVTAGKKRGKKAKGEKIRDC